jgi:hypothetical protein
MKNIVSNYVSRKWWYRYIRTLNWFSFRYYWFNWFLFILAVIVLVWLIRKPVVQKGCSTEVIENAIKVINERLSHCCSCIDQQDPPNTPPLPPNTIQCDGNGFEDEGNNLTPEPMYFEVGTTSGTIQLCYNNGNRFPDNIIIKHNGHIIKETGEVIGSKCIDVPYVYHPGDPTYVEVTVKPSTNPETFWKYTLGCPR